METESNSTYIKVPKSVVQLGAIAILFVIIDLIGGLIDYIQEPEMRISRIIMRSMKNWSKRRSNWQNKSTIPKFIWLALTQ